MKKILVYFVCIIFVTSMQLFAQAKNTMGKNYCKYVNVFVGTGSHGHTYPGVCLPFGMMQLSPDTRIEGWDACAGYHYSDNVIYGFSHTHLSGVGVPDYGDFLFMPTTGKIQLSRGVPELKGSGYRSAFKHENEKAQPGFYSVLLDDYNIKAELTGTERTGFHKYIFPKSDSAHIIIDLEHRDPVIESDIKIVNEYEVEGYRRSTNWALDKRFYFVAVFNKPIKDYSIAINNAFEKNISYASGKNVKAVLNFKTKEGEEILVKVAISAVSVEGARKNLKSETGGWNFAEVKRKAAEKWNKVLSKIEVEGGTENEKEIFYTSLYHCYLTPNLYMDVDGRYRGMDMEIHTAKGFTNYTVFSLWDTYRAVHPLFTILEPEKTNDFIKTLIEKSKQYGTFPMWELAGNDTRCMIGYHAVSVIADAYIKGINNFDAVEALEAMKITANSDKRGLQYYKEFGYVPSNKNSQSVSKTLEYAYNDWCIAKMAEKLNRMDDYEVFIRRSGFYENVFDKSLGFMRGRDSTRQWRTPFDPQSVNYDFTEGNAYQYMYVPHDVKRLIDLLGGEEKFLEWMNKLYTLNLKVEEGEESDISGLIGQYAHGNEPSHHLTYLYNYAGTPWKTQEMVRKILKTMYFNTPGGLCGNEDCGQMSAWYVLSAIGFYQVCPGQNFYELGSPIFNKITINLDNGKKFVINAKNNSEKNIYIENASLDKKTYTKSFITHSDILNGAKLDIKMAAVPNKKWGLQKEDRPSSGKKLEFVSIPFIKSDRRTFIDSISVELSSDTKDAEIYYTLDGSKPGLNSNHYTAPLVINKSAKLKYRAFKKGLEPSYLVESELIKTESQNNIKAANLEKGLTYKYYSGVFRSIWDFEKESACEQGIVYELNLEKRLRDEWFAMEFSGLISVPDDGEYTFFVNADDGGQLTINNKELFESDGRKSFPFEQHASVVLKKGFHKIGVKYFQCSGNKTLEVSWKGPRFARQVIPSSALFHKINVPQKQL